MIPTDLRKITAISITISTFVFVWVLTAGTFDIFAWQFRAGDFYEAQARSWLRGTWAIEPGILGIEAFEVNGSEYTYFGVFPSLLRVPVVLFTRRFDGRLTQISMIGAYILTLVTVARANWQIRQHMSRKTNKSESTTTLVPGPEVDRRDQVLGFAVPLVGGLGSTLFYLSSRPWVYHEAILWGVALAMVSLVALFSYLTSGKPKDLVLASIAAVAALESRPSVGLGPMVALALLALVALLAWRLPNSCLVARLPNIPRPVSTFWVATSAGVFAVASYAWINYMRFGELFRLPLELQTYALQSSERQAVLAANNGSFFGLQFLPTTLFQYLRPDGLSLSRVYPFIGFSPNTRIFGQVSFDTLDPVTSLTSTMPLLALGTIIGIVLVGRALRRNEALGALGIPLFGAAAGAGTTLVFGYIAARYQGDIMPLMFLASLVALHSIKFNTSLATRVGMTLLVVLAFWGVATNYALAITYQRQAAPDIPAELRAELVDDQLGYARWLPGARAPHHVRGDSLPATPPKQPTLFVLGECEALYFGPDANGRWSGVERTRQAGAWKLQVTWGDTEVGVIQPLLANHNTGAGLNALVTRDSADGKISIGYLWRDGNGQTHSDWSRPFTIERHLDQALDIVFDPYNVELKVAVNGRLVFESFRFYPTEGEELGLSHSGGEIAPEFLGFITILPTPKPEVCLKL